MYLHFYPFKNNQNDLFLFLNKSPQAGPRTDDMQHEELVEDA